MPPTTDAAILARSFKFITTALSPRPLLHLRRLCFTTAATPSFEDPTPPPQQQAGSTSYFPKRNQTLQLECESLAYKGKGVCKASGTGFVLLCDRALPGERFVGRVTSKKGSYAEVTKLRTISPHWDIVDAPCEYASY